MTTASLRSSNWKAAPELSSAPRLRLLARGARADAAPAWGPAAGEKRPSGRTAHRPDAHAATDGTAGGEPVLIAGADVVTRAAVHRELAETMPAGTAFEELGTFWELLARAPSCRIVILSGSLDELPAETLLRSLAHRHPDLPVVSLDSPPPA